MRTTPTQIARLQTASTPTTSIHAASTFGARAAIAPTTYRSAHPALRSVPPSTSRSGQAPARGATATEVDAVAHLVETFAPEVTVRAVSRKHDVYVVKAAASGRTRLYRIPVDMVPSTGRLPALPTFDRAA